MRISLLNDGCALHEISRCVHVCCDRFCLYTAVQMKVVDVARFCSCNTCSKYIFLLYRQ